MRRFFVTGTDTDVGKTRVTAGLALALREVASAPTIVKLVQTGLEAGDEGDAALAGRLVDVRYRELVRFRKPADPWSAALAQRADEVRARDLARAVDEIDGALVCEGAGGLAVPLNGEETFATFLIETRLPAVLTVGLRLGCINHALLTLALCAQLSLTVAGVVLVDRWGTSDDDYVSDVRRTLEGRVPILGILPFEVDARRSVEAAARLFPPLF